MRVNVGQAKTELSKLLARVEAGEEVEIARNGDDFELSGEEVDAILNEPI